MKQSLQQLEVQLWSAANSLRGKTVGQDYLNCIKLLVEKREPNRGRVYDPCSQESVNAIRRLACVNLAICGIDSWQIAKRDH